MFYDPSLPIAFSASCLADQRGRCQEARNKHVDDYREGDWSIYVPIYNDVNVIFDVSVDINFSCSDMWKEVYLLFEKLLMDNDFSHLSSKMFFMWKGNHIFTACNISTNSMSTALIGTSSSIAMWLIPTTLLHCS